MKLARDENGFIPGHRLAEGIETQNEIDVECSSRSQVLDRNEAERRAEHVDIEEPRGEAAAHRPLFPLRRKSSCRLSRRTCNGLSRRADSNRGPLHYERKKGRPSGSTEVHS